MVLQRLNKIAIQATAQMASGKEAVGLSRVHTYESKCNLPFRDNCLFMVEAGSYCNANPKLVAGKYKITMGVEKAIY